MSNRKGGKNYARGRRNRNVRYNAEERSIDRGSRISNKGDGVDISVYLGDNSSKQENQIRRNDKKVLKDKTRQENNVVLSNEARCGETSKLGSNSFSEQFYETDIDCDCQECWVCVAKDPSRIHELAEAACPVEHGCDCIRCDARDCLQMRESNHESQNQQEMEPLIGTAKSASNEARCRETSKRGSKSFYELFYDADIDCDCQECWVCTAKDPNRVYKLAKAACPVEHGCDCRNCFARGYLQIRENNHESQEMEPLIGTAKPSVSISLQSTGYDCQTRNTKTSIESSTEEMPPLQELSIEKMPPLQESSTEEMPPLQCIQDAKAKEKCVLLPAVTEESASNSSKLDTIIEELEEIIMSFEIDERDELKFNLKSEQRSKALKLMKRIRSEFANQKGSNCGQSTTEEQSYISGGVRTSGNTIDDFGETVLIFPKSNPSDAHALDILTEHLNPHEHNIRFRTSRKIKNQGFAITCDTEEEVDKIILEIEKRPELNNLITTRKAGPRLPAIVIFDIDCKMDKDKLTQHLQALYNNDNCRALFPLKQRNGKLNWVVRIPPPEVQQNRKRFSITIGWKSFMAKEYLGVKRCFRCQKYGHVRTECNAASPTCAMCAERHDSDTCNATLYKCINCLKANEKNGSQLPYHHSAKDLFCPSYNLECDRVIQSMSYEPFSRF